MLREIVEARNNRLSIKYKGGKAEDKEKIIELISRYDLYSHMIDSYPKQQKVDKNNKLILSGLKKLGITQFSNGDKLKEIK